MSFNYNDEVLDLLLKKSLGASYTASKYIPGQEEAILTNIQNEQIFALPITNKNPGDFTWSTPTEVSDISGATVSFLENVLGESNIDYTHIKKYENIPFSSIPGTNYRAWKPINNDMKDKFKNTITGKSNFQFTITTNIPGAIQMNSSNIAYKPIISNGVLVFIGNAIPNDATISLNELYIYEGYFGIKKLNLTDLEDVNPAETIIENSSTLVYDANEDVWKVTAPAPPRNSLGDLNDVFVDGGIITDNDTLVYNANLGQFVLGQVEMDVRFDNLPGINLGGIQVNDWSLTSTIRGDDTTTNDHFGERLSYTDSNIYLAIGVPKKAGVSNELESGAVYVYDTRPMDSNQDNPAVAVQIVKPPENANQEDYVNFGSSVHINDTYLMIGAPKDDFLDYKGDPKQNNGVVYSYVFNSDTNYYGGFTEFDKEFTVSTYVGKAPGRDPLIGIELRNPKGMTVDVNKKDIYLADMNNVKIQKFEVNPNGATDPIITTLDLDSDSQVYQYSSPYGIVYDDKKTHRYRYDYINTTDLINTSKKYGVAPDDKTLSNPNEIKLQDNYYWIADTDNNRILRLDSDFNIFSNDYPIDMTGGLLTSADDIDTKPLSVAYNSTLTETHVNIDYTSSTVSTLQDTPIDIKLIKDSNNNHIPTLYYFKKDSNNDYYVEKINHTLNNDSTIVIKVNGGNTNESNGDYYMFTDNDNNTINIGNGTFRFFRGRTYKFEAHGIYTSHPFKIYMSGSFVNNNNGNNNGITGSSDSITITIPPDHSTSSGELYYQCGIHSSMKKNMLLLPNNNNEVINITKIEPGLVNPTSFTTNITPLVIEKTEVRISTVSSINQSQEAGSLYVGASINNPTNDGVPITVSGAKSGAIDNLNTTTTGSGSGAIVDVTISYDEYGIGKVTSYTIVSAGSGYQTGDTITIQASSIPGTTLGQTATSDIVIKLTAENLVATNSNTNNTSNSNNNSGDGDNSNENNNQLVDTVVDTEQRGADIYMLHTTLTNGTTELSGATNNSKITRKANEPDSDGNPIWVERPFANGLEFSNARSIIYDPSSVTLYENTIQSLTTVQGKTQPIEELGKMMKFPLEHQDLNDSDYNIYALDIGSRKLLKLRWDKLKNGEEDFNGLNSNSDLVDAITSNNSGFTNGDHTGLELSDSTGIQKKGGIVTIKVDGETITSVIVTTTGSDYLENEVLTIYNDSRFDGLTFTLRNTDIDIGSTDLITTTTTGNDNSFYPTTFAIHSDFPDDPDDDTFTSTPYIYIFNSFGTKISRYQMNGTKDNTFEEKIVGFQIMDMILDFNNDIIVSKENDNVYRISDRINYILFDKEKNIGEIQSGEKVTAEDLAEAGTYPPLGSNRNAFLDTESENGDASSHGSGAKVRVVTTTTSVMSVVVLQAGRGYKAGNNLKISAVDIGKSELLLDLIIKLTQKDADALNGPFVRPISTNMVDPTKLKLDSAGNIFVCESGANRISKIMFDGTNYIGRFNVLSEGLDNPVNFELDGDPLDYGFIARRKDALLNAITDGNGDLPDGTYFNVPTDTDSDYGGGAFLTIVVYGGIVTSVTATITGSDYLPGDELYVDIPDDHASLPEELNDLVFELTKNHLEGVKMIILNRGTNKIIEANAPSNLEYYDHGITPEYYINTDSQNNGFGKFYGSRNIYKVGEIRGEQEGSLTEQNKVLQLLNEELLDVNMGNTGVTSTTINGKKVYTSGEPIYIQSFKFNINDQIAGGLSATPYLTYKSKVNASRVGDFVYSTKRNIKELVFNPDNKKHEDAKEYKLIGKENGPVELNINVDAYLPNVDQPNISSDEQGDYDAVYVNVKTACTPSATSTGGSGAELTFIIHNDVVTTFTIANAGSGYSIGDTIFPEDDNYTGPYDIQFIIPREFKIKTNQLTQEIQSIEVDNTGPDIDNLEINQVTSNVLYRVKSNDLQLGEEIDSNTFSGSSENKKQQLFNRIKNRMEGYYKIKEVIDDPLYGSNSHKYLIRGPNDGSFDGQEMGNVQVYKHDNNYTPNHIKNQQRFVDLTTDDYIYIYGDDGKLKAKIPIVGIDIDENGNKKVRLYPLSDTVIGSLKVDNGNYTLFNSIVSDITGFTPGTYENLVLSDETGDGDGGEVTIVVGNNGEITSLSVTITGSEYQSGSEIIIYNENDDGDQIPHNVFSGLSIVLQPGDIDTTVADDY